MGAASGALSAVAGTTPEPSSCGAMLSGGKSDMLLPAAVPPVGCLLAQTGRRERGCRCRRCSWRARRRWGVAGSGMVGRETLCSTWRMSSDDLRARCATRRVGAPPSRVFTYTAQPIIFRLFATSMLCKGHSIAILSGHPMARFLFLIRGRYIYRSTFAT